MNNKRASLRRMFGWKRVTGLLATLTWLLRVQAQAPEFHHLTVENGLSHNAVLAIAQDSRGFMWYGTEIGLNRYDGHRFRVYKTSRTDTSTLSDNNILALLPDSGGVVWAGTAGGLNRYDPATDAFTRIRLAASPASANITCLYKDRHGRIWAGTGNGLYLLTDRLHNTFRLFYRTDPVQSGSTNTIRSVFEDFTGNLWIGSNTGLTCLFAGKGVRRRETFRSDPDLPGSISANYITSIAEDHRHRLWVGTSNNGLNLLDRATSRFTRFVQAGYDPAGLANNHVRKILCDRKGKLWIGTQEGLTLLDPDTYRMASYRHQAEHPKSLSQNSIYSLFEDRAGSVWVGTYFGGVNQADPFSTPFVVMRSREEAASLSNNVISSIAEDSVNNFWIGTEGGGLNRYDPQTGRFTAFTTSATNPASLASNLIKVVYCDHDGQIWAGTHGGGLNLYDRKANTFKRFFYRENDAESLAGEVLSLLEDSQNRFWAGTNSGLRVFKRKGTRLEPWPDTILAAQGARKIARSLLEDSRHRIWIGTNSGLFLLQDGKMRELSAGFINCIQEDSRGNIWAGLNYGGLSLFDTARQRLVCFTRQDGLQNRNVIGILEDGRHHLWLSTDNGLFRLDPDHRQLYRYTVSDGLADNAFNYNSYFHDSHGEFYCGGYNGLTRFFPDRITLDSIPASLVFTGLKLRNQPVALHGPDGILKKDIGSLHELRFRHDQDVFTIEFALLNFVKSSKNRYAYRLEGVDKAWLETGTPEVTYPNLPPGTYTFRVKGANNDGFWSRPSVLTIRLLPPFWLTWWAEMIYVLLAAGVCFLVVRYLFLKALFRKEEELHQVKLNFFTNISHEIRTHLTLINVPLEKIGDAPELSSATRRQLQTARRSAGQLFDLVSELMDFRKADTRHLQLHTGCFNLNQFLSGICDGFREVASSKNISLLFHAALHDPEAFFDKEQMAKVFYNLLSNAFKFTPSGGRVEVRVEEEKERFRLTVTDNGRGISPDHLQNLFTNFFQVADHGFQNTGYGIGLALSRNIVELHKGTIGVESEPAAAGKQGSTRFTVLLLKGDEHLEVSIHHTKTDVMGTPPPATAPAITLQPDTLNKAFTVMVIEDHAALRALISSVLQGGYRILEYEDGAAGWYAAAAQLPDLVISDVMMPGLDGFTLCTKLKTDPRTSHIPVILLTARDAPADQVSGLERGADIYMTKPFNTRVLELHVRNLIDLQEKLRRKFSENIVAAEAAETTAASASLTETWMNPVDRDFMQQVMNIIDAHLDDPAFGVDMLARKVAMSQPVLYKKLKALTNMSVNEFIKTLRLKKAATLLQKKQLAVYEVAYAVGYLDRKYFSREFKKQFGKTPSEWS